MYKKHYTINQLQVIITMSTKLGFVKSSKHVIYIGLCDEIGVKKSRFSMPI